MLNEENEESDPYSKLDERMSQCSTNIDLCPHYQESFFVDKEENLDHFVRLKLDQQKIVYEYKKMQKFIPLSLTVLEQSVYLRDHRTVFAIKLSYQNQSTTFSTFNKDHFITLYLILARKCILTGFQKHYRVGKLLGMGTFGKVYDGYNLFSNENVALKVITKDEIKKTPNGIQMIFNQIKALQKLKKFHISPLISTFQSTDCYILVLQKGSGGNLIQYLKANPHRYNPKMIKCIFKQVLQNVNLLHEAGIIHRDIKPENIICKDSPMPSIFLCDYGISIQKSQLNFNLQEVNIAGTIGYIAPQIVNQQPYNQKSDIFSVGSLFYYLFTGRRLFETRNYYQLRVMTQDSQYLDRKIEELRCVNFELRDLLQKMLKFKSRQRISAKEALKHSYFKDSECFIPNLGQFDQTLRDYIENKISHYWY